MSRVKELAGSRWVERPGLAAAHGASATYVAMSVQARRLAVVVTTCLTCGAIDVTHAGVYLGRISLTSTTTQAKQLRWLPLQSTARTGTVTLRTLNTRLSGTTSSASRCAPRPTHRRTGLRSPGFAPGSVQGCWRGRRIPDPGRPGRRGGRRRCAGRRSGSWRGWSCRSRPWPQRP